MLWYASPGLVVPSLQYLSQPLSQQCFIPSEQAFNILGTNDSVLCEWMRNRLGFIAETSSGESASDLSLVHCVSYRASKGVCVNLKQAFNLPGNMAAL